MSWIKCLIEKILNMNWNIAKLGPGQDCKVVLVGPWKFVENILKM